MRLLLCATFVAMALAGQQSAHALATGPTDHSHKIMKLDSSVVTKPGSFIVELHDEHDAHSVKAASTKARSILKRSVEKFDVGHHYDSVFKGFSVRASADLDPVHLARLPGVKRVWPVQIYKALAKPATHGSIYNSEHKYTGVERIAREFGLTGKGVKIGIVDSGVDYTHPELGGCWKTPGCIWQYGQDFIGDKYNTKDDNPIIEPNPTPMDCTGHGTHVAGTIGGQGPLVTGVAPNATLGMYRALSCDGSGPDEAIIASIEAAYKDGHDIISLSLGGLGWSESPLSVVCENLVKKGVIVVAANGNDGDKGLFTSGTPAVGNGVINVGSADNWEYTGTSIEFSSSAGQKTLVASAPISGDHPFFFNNPVEIVVPTKGSEESGACPSFDSSVQGKVVLVPSDECGDEDKAINAQSAGAIGLVVYGGTLSDLALSTKNSTITIPVVVFGKDNTDTLISTLVDGKATIKTPKRELVAAPGPTGGQMSSFSSFGPAPELGVGPVVSAPGGNIYSTYLVKNGGYASMSGTSMATPYIAGVLALIKQAHPEYTPAQISSIIASTAQPVSDKTTGLNIHPYHSGSGLVDAYAALTTRAEIYPLSFTLNSTDIGPLKNAPGLDLPESVRWVRRTITIKNRDTSRTARVALANSVADAISPWHVNGTFTKAPRIWPQSADDFKHTNQLPVVFTNDLKSTNSIGPGSQRDIEVYIVAPYGLKESERWFFGGFINITLSWDGKCNNKKHYVIPYAGYNGDFTQVDVARSTDNYPLITDKDGTPHEDLTTFGADASNPLNLAFYMDLPSRLVSISLINSKNETLGYLPKGYREYVTRTLNDPATEGFVSVISGTVFTDTELTNSVQVPKGLYRAVLGALRPFGDITKQSDYQVMMSQVFSIA